MSTSKSGATPWGFFCTFWLGIVLRATVPCTFSTSQLPKVVRTWGVFSFFTYKCASRHNGVHSFISHLARWLRTRRFSEPTFDPPEPQIIGKTQCFATFLPFRAPASSFFWFFLFSDLLSSSLLFSGSSHFCFSSVHIVGSLTSKLPSIRNMVMKNLQPQTGPGQNIFFSFFYRFGHHFIYHFLFHLYFHSFFFLSFYFSFFYHFIFHFLSFFYHFIFHFFFIFFSFYFSFFYHFFNIFSSSGAKKNKKWKIAIFLEFFSFFYHFLSFYHFSSFFIIFHQFHPPLEAKMIKKW